MTNSQHHFSEWAKTYSRRNTHTPIKQWPPIDDFYWKAAVLIAVTYFVWIDKPITSFFIDQGDRSHPTTFSLWGDMVEAPAKPIKTNTQSKKPNPESVKVNIPVSAAGNEKSADYIKRFAPVAVAEMRKYGIPASIILAQGLLESNSGSSTLANKANNHFGIKCFAKGCRKGHCLNHKDDSHKDFFVRYNNAWSSYRAHSEFLSRAQRYRHLFKSRDYTVWATGLERSGYATDRRYAEKLISVIRKDQLDRLDNQA